MCKLIGSNCFRFNSHHRIVENEVSFNFRKNKRDLFIGYNLSGSIYRTQNDW